MSANAKKYLFIIDTVKQGGAENILLRFAAYLESIKIPFQIFVLFGQGESHSIPGIFKKNQHSFFLKFLQQMYLGFKFRRKIKHYQPDIIFSFLERSNTIALDAAPPGCKVIVSVHNHLGYQYKKYKRLKRGLVKYILRKKYNGKATKIIAVSQSIKENLQSEFGIQKDRIIVINNAIDKEKITTLSQKKIIKTEPGEKTIINVGRAEYQKGQWKLLKAVSYLKTHYGRTDIKLTILGDGSYLPDLKNLAFQLSVADQVQFLGFIQNPFPYLIAADLLVLPSIFEGFPVTVSEAAALDTAFVGSRTAIPKEIFQTPKQWENFTYSNTSTRPDFSTSILDDDIDLARLILKGLKNKKDLLAAGGRWVSANTELSNFEKYCSL